MSNTRPNRTFSNTQALFWSLAAVVCFHVAYILTMLSPAIVAFLYCLFELRKVGSNRKAFYFGLVIGLLVYAPYLSFFWTIFKGAAIALWLVLAFWLALFLLLIRTCATRLSPATAAILIPFLWTGLEYFRSELYYLRFSWLNIGFAFPKLPGTIGFLGMYGIGFLFAAVAAALGRFKRTQAAWAVGFICIPMLWLEASDPAPKSATQEGTNATQIAGVQLEFPHESEVLNALDQLTEKHPAAEILILSEHTFDGPVPEKIREWCNKTKRYLVVGGKETAGEDFYNTAFVIGPTGEIIFKQCKSVPIQFFKDGLPAKEQRLWNSPWGKIGICVCYDLSYRRVVDELIRQGAQALIVPTMDVMDWGEAQHNLHARVAPMRAAEFGVPVYRLCSSGISQFVAANGSVMSTAPFPGQNEILVSTLRIAPRNRLPLDHWLAPFSVLITAGITLWLCISAFRKSKNQK